ncbi:Uncharacterised protein [uncultured archaeon]|nr:Uncharacterised protein [uncultured archaeon]
MNESTFFASEEEAKNLLKKFNLLKSSDFLKKPISERFVEICRNNNFIDAYFNALRNYDYHLLLFDDSFFQFEFLEKGTKLQLRYSYYQNPFVLPPSSYLGSMQGDEYLYDYDQVFADAHKKDFFLYVRYDYSEKEYTEGVHSVSHFHIGSGDSIRITSYISITPLLFVIFVIKNIYPKQWHSLMKDGDFLDRYKKLKVQCEKIEKRFFKELDKYELYLA